MHVQRRYGGRQGASVRQGCGGWDYAVVDDTTIYFGGPAGTTATSSLYLMLTSANTGTGVYNFNYIFTNTNPSVSNLTGFGFQTTPTLLGITGSGMNFVLNPINFPGGYDVDACAYVGNNCDAANNQGDLFSGAFSLTFAGGTSSISLTDFVDRYASLTQLGGISGEGTPVRPPVPEPATWAMMLLGFGGIGMTRNTTSIAKPVANPVRRVASAHMPSPAAIIR